MNNKMIDKEISGIIMYDDGGKFMVMYNNITIQCTAKGSFFNKEQQLLAGDYVKVLLDDEGKGQIFEILPRKNSLVRPRIANLDTLFIVISVCEPTPSLLVVDKLITICYSKNIKPVIIVTKSDLKNADKIITIYKNAGFDVLVFDYNNHNNDEIRNYVKDGIFAFCGNTGVGKSTVLNAIFKQLDLKTGEISKKLGRGKHTTRLVSLISIDENTFIADTPGFGAVDLMAYGLVTIDELQYCFPEFSDYVNTCKFSGCSHKNEPGCNIIKALNDGNIEKSRYNNYVVIYDELKKNTAKIY